MCMTEVENRPGRAPAFRKNVAPVVKEFIDGKGPDSMLRDRVYDYYINKGANCSECLLHAADDEYRLNLPAECYKLIGGYGLGMGCQSICGALCSAVAVVSFLKVQGKAHATPNFSAICAGMVDKFIAGLGDTNCSKLRALYRKDDVRCLKTLELAADALESYLGEIGAVARKEA